ncbi:MAG: hypothetical protein BGO98_31250 [Myxococcales bacterium 68-20]|nr:hypothetical protein [Myxococcales bacterium]OJY18244.1 MAG: hypothetical protein BGO98_31250 [Myxococcales bacterium 68-20]
MARSVELRTLAAGAFAYVLPERVRIAIGGPDGPSWLGGVLTCVAGSSATYGCALNVAGKIVSDVYVIGANGELGAYVGTKSLARILGLWEKQIVMEEVVLSRDAMSMLVLIQGASARSLVESAGLGEVALPLDDVAGGCVIEADAAAIPDLMTTLHEAGVTRLREAELASLRVQAARATFGADFVVETSSVHELGLEHRAVSHTKGMYLGHRAVCSTEMRGRASRRLVQLRFDSHGKDVVLPGAEVNIEGQAIGSITTSTALDRAVFALAMVKHSEVAQGTRVRVGDLAGEITQLAG